MKPISTKTHGILDYFMGAILILSPWLFGFANFETAQNVVMVTGISMIVYSVFTNYEQGMVRILNMRAHLLLDFMMGLFIAASPWLFDFSGYVYIPHLILGIAGIGLGMITEPGYHFLRKPLLAGSPRN